MGAAAGTPVVEFEDVCVSFGEECVLEGITFAVERGETLVIQGAAASGKTLILKLALGLLRPARGRIRLFGEDVSGYRDEQWNDARARIGMLFQEGGLFDSLTVEENVAYPLLNQKRGPLSDAEIRRRVQEALDFVELGHTLDKLPSELSGGMRRRVGIARAIVTQPELLLYDSPTAGLDPITATTIMALIVKGRDASRATTIMVTHRHQDGQLLERYRWDAATGRLAPAEPGTTRTRYMVLREGRIVFLGTGAEFDACEDPYVAKFASR